MDMINELESTVQSVDGVRGMEILQKIKIAKLTGTSDITELQYCQALECGVLLSILQKDNDEDNDNKLEIFNRQYQQLEVYYKNGIKTQRQKHLQGLNLMALLVNNNSSEFHSELEILLQDGTNNENKYIQFPIAIERKMMVGIYDQIWEMEMPDKHTYQFFMDQLVTTIRDAIADNIEVSYNKLTIQQAATLMNESDINHLLNEYIPEVRDDWIIDGDIISFAVTSASVPGTAAGATAADIPSKQWIQNTLTYATEMERIV